MGSFLLHLARGGGGGGGGRYMQQCIALLAWTLATLIFDNSSLGERLNTCYVKFCSLSAPAPAEVSVVDIVNGSDSSTVTIEWTPPTDSSLEYTITTTPIPISPNMSVTTTSPTMDIIVEYNRDYTITVSLETCAGPRQTNTTVFIGMLQLILYEYDVMYICIFNVQLTVLPRCFLEELCCYPVPLHLLVV